MTMDILHSTCEHSRMWAPLDIPGLTFRSVTPRDDEFVFQTIKATMREYVEKTFGPWDEADQRRITKEKTDYDAVRIIQRQGKDIGLMTVMDKGDHLRLEQLYILPPIRASASDRPFWKP